MPVSDFVSVNQVPAGFRRIPLLVGLIVFLAAISVASVSAAGDDEDRTTGRYIVLLEDSVKHPGAVAETQVEQRDGQVGFVYRHALNGYSAELPKAAVKSLRNDPRVKSVEADVLGGVASQTTPTGIDRIFATANEALHIDGEDDRRVDADAAVLDTGIDNEHPDLNVVSQIDCNSEAPACVEGGNDGYGHGTHVAGTIAAIDDGSGVVGVAPGARLWGVKVLNNKGSGALSEYIAGIDWITATRQDENPENDIEVANSSLRYFTTFSSALEEALSASVETGIVHVVAAGNEHEAVKYVPGNSPWVITVSALADYDGLAGGEASPSCSSLGSDDSLASFSNYGNLVEVAAPGACIYSTVPGGSYAYSSGTSMASPHVAGAAAILAASNKPESQGDVEAIRETIVETGNSGWEDTSGDGVKEPLLDVSNEEVFSIAEEEEVEAPSATTEAATSVTSSSAKLHGTVNPNGASTTYQLEYGTTTSYGSKAPVSPKEIGSGSEGVAVSETISGLEPETTYHFRVVATNGAGTVKGEDKTFATSEEEAPEAPSATTESATNVTASGAKLRGTVDPNGAKTTYQFEYGTTTSYGSKAPASPKEIGSGSEGVAVSETIGGLEPETTYHFRVVGTNAAGSAYGEDETFVTGEAEPESEWELESMFNPSAAEGSVQVLTDASCNTAGLCMAVGVYSNSGGFGSLAETSEGGEWTNASLSAKAEARDVECVVSGGVNECIALGNKEGEAAWGQRWSKAGGWVSMTTPTPAKAVSSEFRGAGCAPVEEEELECLGVGAYFNGEEELALAMRWDAETEKFVILTTPSEGIGSMLNDVSCNAVGSCVAVGDYYTETGDIRPFSMQWNGTTWSIKAVPTPEAGGSTTHLYDVSCTGAAGPSTRCIAVGTNIEAPVQVAVSMYWDGEEWSEVAPEKPAGLEGNYTLNGVSCSSGSQCYAVGEYVPGERKTLIEEWNGAEWSIVPSPSPSPWSTLVDVSCIGASTDCIAVGMAEGPGRIDTLGMHHE